MIVAFVNRQSGLQQLSITEFNANVLTEAIWIDLISPTKVEEDLIEKSLGFNIPTRDEMVEIELSSRLYKENGVLFMTATVIAHSDSPNPTLDPITFVLLKHTLLTVRYVEPRSFELFILQLKKSGMNFTNAILLLLELLNANIDRLADILEYVARNLEEASKQIFRPRMDDAKLDYQQVMKNIGAQGDLNTKARESSLTFNRLVPYLAQAADSQIDNEGQLKLRTLNQDIAALSDYANFLSTKVTFLLDAMLGMVSIEQNNIIKIFSVAAVIFLPPTLVASIYGMNFHMMPELSWRYGYVFAIGLIMIAAWLPYKYFKYRKWL